MKGIKASNGKGSCPAISSIVSGQKIAFAMKVFVVTVCGAADFFGKMKKN